MKSLSLFVFMSLVVLFYGCSNNDNLIVYDLKCENLSNPLGIDNITPRFSWKIQSNKNGTEQKAYQVMVASNPSMFEKEQADVWNSGKIESAASIMVPYEGKTLTSGGIYYWKVRVWDEAGEISHWSPLAEFSVGLLNKTDWQAVYIGFPTDLGHSECPQLKKTFQIEDIGQKLLLHVNSLGYHEVYLNGQKVGNGVLTPAVSQFDKRSRVVTYDISNLLKMGSNELMFWLGSGWYSKGLPGVTYDGPLVKAQLEKLSEKRKDVILITDASWLGRKSSYTRHGRWRSGHYGGEILDASLEKNDLSGNSSAEKSWQAVSVIDVPEHEASPQMVELNKIEETLKPVKIEALGKDTFLIDMGKNHTGWTEIHFQKLKRSQKISIEYSDHLDNNGKFIDKNHKDWYIASGEEPEVFINKFNYHGYRYIRISNLEEAPAADSIKAYLIHTGYDLASGFQCSDPEMNQIHDMVFYTLRCLSLGGDLVDCPQIERLGYGGDGNASTQTAQTMFNLNPLYANWLQAWADVIREDGGMPHTAPNPYPAGGGPYWCGFIITASWKTYQNYGDSTILEKYYPDMQKWLGYVDKYTVDGLLKRWPDTDYRGWYLGDWATPDGIDQMDESSVDLINNCFVAVCYDNMQRIAEVMGKPDDSGLYASKKAELQKQIHQVYFDPEENSYATGTQIDLSYPMLAGVVPEGLISAVTQSLINETENRGGNLATGLVGIPVLTEWVIENQAADLMYSMLKKKDYPGYLYMIANGATTTWEHWNGDRSHIHNCYNGIGSWFYQAVGGIRPDEASPAYRKVLIQPQIPQGITWAKTFKETPYGKLSVNWELKEQSMEMDVEIPVGTEARIAIPSGLINYRMNGKDFNVSEEQTNFILVKSGRYKIVFFS